MVITVATVLVDPRLGQLDVIDGRPASAGTLASILATTSTVLTTTILTTTSTPLAAARTGLAPPGPVLVPGGSIVALGTRRPVVVLLTAAALAAVPAAPGLLRAALLSPARLLGLPGAGGLGRLLPSIGLWAGRLLSRYILSAGQATRVTA